MPESGPTGDEAFDELIGFLQDQKPEVQRFASEGVLAQTDSQDFLEYCQRVPRKVSRLLLRVVESAEAKASSSEAAGDSTDKTKETEKIAVDRAAALDTGSSALQALVNISAVPAVIEELVSLSAPRRITEALRSGWLDGRAELAHWYAMLLANITTTEKGQEAISSEESLLRFLLAAFVAKPRPKPRDGYDDPLLYLGKVINNTCVLEAGRRILAGGESGAGNMALLASELGERGRRPDVLSIFRNICLDKECHSVLISANLMYHIAPFVYPLEKVEADRLADLPEALRQKLEAEGAALTGEASVRRAAILCIIGLCRSAEGRTYLRGSGCYEVMRAWHLEETDDGTKDYIETAVPAVHLSEEELQAEKQKHEKSSQESQATAADKPPTDGPVLPPAAEGPALPPSRDGPAPSPSAEGKAALQAYPAPVVAEGPLPPPIAKSKQSGKEDENLEGLFDEIEEESNKSG